MTAEQYKLRLAAQWLNTIAARDHAIEAAAELYYLGHRLDVVKALVTEARLLNHQAIRLKRGAQ